uniref:Cytochrome b6-f complex subunit 6 n=1 Tax=Olisthodiscus luteus TaxID=83000 RepID=A0A7U0KSU1_OLILU|nr:cytochrome b6-f complex subunit 6 [Olisthodiscus luteus]QQW50536.1 cytochrome b6-f complex subunit 6 [Olisthodiscus luteus]
MTIVFDYILLLGFIFSFSSALFIGLKSIRLI